MGNSSFFKINNDGSVTTATEPDPHVKTILDIFRVEKSKGGVLAARHMKKRALQYAKAAGCQDATLLVERLLLEHYPEEFKNIKLSSRLIGWSITAVISLLLIILLSLRAIDNINASSSFYQEFYNYDYESRQSGGYEYLIQMAWVYDQYATIELISAGIFLMIAVVAFIQCRKQIKHIRTNQNIK